MNRIDNALILLHEKLCALPDEWMIIGTSSLYLMGYPVSPNDIDILCDEDTAAEIETLLMGFRAESPVVPNEKFSSIFSSYFIGGCKVEVMGNLNVNTVTGWVLLRDQITNSQTVLFKNKAFSVPSRADQLHIYKLFNRAKDEPVLLMIHRS